MPLRKALTILNSQAEIVSFEISCAHKVVMQTWQDAKLAIRKLRIALESNYKVKIGLAHPIVSWMIRHAGFVHHRFQVGEDGKTPYQRIRGKVFDKPICELGESVFYKIPKRMIGPELNK